MKRNRVYMVKNLTPWMMDELKSFSDTTVFTLVLLREPPDFYSAGLAYLKENKVDILNQPFTGRGFLKKTFFALGFFLRHLGHLDLGYSTVLLAKSMGWFIRLDLDRFDRESSIHAQFATQPALIAYMIKDYYGGEPKNYFTFHAYDIYFKNKWFRTLVDNAEMAFSISQFNIDFVKNKFGERGQYALTRLGVFRSRIRPKTEHAPNERMVLGLMSWFVEKKGIIYLLEAIKILKAQGVTDLELRLAGDGPLKPELEKYVKDNGLEAQVHFLGKVSMDEKESFYHELDLFALPSIQLKTDQDGIPVVLMEAIAFGLPIISTRVSGIPEICVQDYNGELIEQRDAQALAEAIKRLLDSPELRARYAASSLLKSDEYDIEINSRSKLAYLNWIEE